MALSTLLFIVCITDYCWKRIPNECIVLLFAVGWGYRFGASGWIGLWEYFVGGLSIFLLTYPFYKIGAVGAGDVKLFTVTAGCLSGKAICSFLLFTLLIAAIFSVLKLLKEQNGKERFRYLWIYVTEVVRTGKWEIYGHDEKGKENTGICLSGPVFLSILLHVCGVY